MILEKRGYIREKSGKGEHMKNLIVLSHQKDPFINQAIEHYLLTQTQGYERIMYLWVNSPCAFIGRNQNPWKELELDFLIKNSIPFLRRNSGGGTVYHDEGNLNVSFIDPLKNASAEENLNLIQAAMLEFDIQLTQNERFDLRFNANKVTGSAFYIHKKRKLHHCTLLLNVNVDKLWASLKFENEGITTRSVKSIKSPVVNLVSQGVGVTMIDVKQSIISKFFSLNSLKKSLHDPSESLDVVEAETFIRDWSEVEAISEMFKDNRWRFGETPDFTYTTSSGEVFKISKGKVKDVEQQKFGSLEDTYFSVEKIESLSKTSTPLEGGRIVNLKEYNPLTDEMIQIMDKDGNIVHPELMPDLNENQILHMYKTMVKSRVTDIKTLQFQRQGRILTYAPNLGQEAAQVGTIAASEKTDWVASAFRELGAWLYREAPLYNILLYWLGNEEGMKMPEHVRILPVSVPIASQLQHATGLAFASVYKGEKDVVLGYVGDGGTSQGDFHEALNFAAVMNVPSVFIVQNNQFAISTRRAVQTKAKTIAQKALAYGMPGYQVDGNDIFAVYAVTKMAVDRARKGEGPTLIEAYTYRLGAHTTADDPTVYREDAEVEEWKEKDPIDRLRKYLIARELWSEEQDEQLKKDYEEEVRSTFEKVEQSGLVSLEAVFDYQYAKRTDNLEAQYQELKQRAKEVK